LRSRFAWRRQLSAAGEPAWFASWLDTETGARQREAWRSSLPVSQRADLWRVRNLQCCMPPETLSNHTEQTLCSPYSGKPLLHYRLSRSYDTLVLGGRLLPADSIMKIFKSIF
jgi:hypothetical protein